MDLPGVLVLAIAQSRIALLVVTTFRIGLGFGPTPSSWTKIRKSCADRRTARCNHRDTRGRKLGLNCIILISDTLVRAGRRNRCSWIEPTMLKIPSLNVNRPGILRGRRGALIRKRVVPFSSIPGETTTQLGILELHDAANLESICSGPPYANLMALIWIICSHCQPLVATVAVYLERRICS